MKPDRIGLKVAFERMLVGNICYALDMLRQMMRICGRTAEGGSGLKRSKTLLVPSHHGSDGCICM